MSQKVRLAIPYVAASSAIVVTLTFTLSNKEAIEENVRVIRSHLGFKRIRQGKQKCNQTNSGSHYSNLGESKGLRMVASGSHRDNKNWPILDEF